MNQNDLARAVAQATGESVRTVKRLGFLLVPDPADFEQPDAMEAQVIDWDEFYQDRQPRLRTRRKSRAAAVC